MYLFFDTETTGLNRNTSHLVQIAWILIDEDGNEESRRNHIIRPDGFIIPHAASEIHGITTTHANKYGEPLEDVLEEFTDVAELATILIAHNIDYDIAILKNDFNYVDLEFPLHGKTKICTMKLSTAWCRLPKMNNGTGFKYPRLEELHYRLFGKGFANAHDAMADVEACMRCYFGLVEHGVIIPPDAFNLAPPPKSNERTKTIAATANTSTSNIITSTHIFPTNIQDSVHGSTSPPSLPPTIKSILELMASSNDMHLKCAAASHPLCTNDLLGQLAQDKNIDVLNRIALNSNANSETLRVIASNPKANSETLRVIVSNPIANEETLRIFLRKNKINYDTASIVAKNLNCPTELLYRWSWQSFGEKNIWKVIAKNPSTPDEILAALWWDSSSDNSLRKEIKSHPSFTNDKLKMWIKEYLKKYSKSWDDILTDLEDYPEDVLICVLCYESPKTIDAASEYIENLVEKISEKLNHDKKTVNSAAKFSLKFCQKCTTRISLDKVLCSKCNSDS